MRGEKHDLIHVYGVGNAFAIPFLKWGGRKVVISVDAEDWVREKWGVVGKNYLLLAARFSTKMADCVIVDSQAIGDVYRAQFGADTSYVAYGAETDLVDGTVWLDKFGLETGRYHLFVGRLTPEKRPHTLIEAYKKVTSDMPLVIVGDDRYHQDYIAEMKRNADVRVRFVGTVYDDGFRGLCRHSYLYLTASTIEGTSPALLQAMGQGAAVLVNGIPANRETIGDAGFAYNANDTQDLARQWQHLIDNPAIVAETRRKARQRIQTHYTWELVSEQLFNLYSRLLGRRT
jgi:glycosyltransferase involved in cell wall biosynthesis